MQLPGKNILDRGKPGSEAVTRKCLAGFRRSMELYVVGTECAWWGPEVAKAGSRRSQGVTAHSSGC